LCPFLVVFLAFNFGTNPKNLKEDAQLLFLISAVSWVAILAFCARFLLGRPVRQTGRLVVLPELQISQSTLRGDMRSLSSAPRDQIAVHTNPGQLARFLSRTKAQAVAVRAL
jgi:hypothetical protein